jgi:hypothetical protein
MNRTRELDDQSGMIKRDFLITDPAKINESLGRVINLT